jgi:hypothetical protein
MEIEKEDILGAYRGVLQEKRSIENDLAALRLTTSLLITTPSLSP